MQPPLKLWKLLEIQPAAGAICLNTAILTASYLCHGPWDDAPVVWVAKHGVGLATACLAVSKDAHLRRATSSTAELSANFVSVAQLTLTLCLCWIPTRVLSYTRVVLLLCSQQYNWFASAEGGGPGQDSDPCPYLVAVQSTLDELTDLLKDCGLV